jgi:hypothetical protein
MADKWRKPSGMGVNLTRRTIGGGGNRRFGGHESQALGIRAWEALDPYSSQEREEFKLSMKNPYVKRACRIQTNFVVGQGYTTKCVPREEEELQEEQQSSFEQTPIHVPAFDVELTPEQIKDKIDKMMKRMDLSQNLFNAYYTGLQQGRAILAMTPLEKDDMEEFFMMPEQFRFIRPEHSLRPVVDQDTGELKGVRIIGIETNAGDNILDIKRAVYIMHGFNNELFSDFFGDSKVADIADIASNLNVVLNQDYEQAALHSWFTPPVFSVPIPPQEFGNEEGVLNTFLNSIADSKGQITAVTSSSNPEEKGVELLNSSTNSGNISGLDIIRLGLIKAIIAHFGIPGFMISEGDVGQLGGNTNISEMDNYLNVEIAPERKYMENVVSQQIYDRIIEILFQVEEADDAPIRLLHTFNKPKIISIIPKDLYEVYIDMLERGLIEEDGFRELTGLEEFAADKMNAKGADASPAGNRAGADWTNQQWKSKQSGKGKWANANWSPIQLNVWPDKWNGQPNVTASKWKTSGQPVSNKWKSLGAPF